MGNAETAPRAKLITSEMPRTQWPVVFTNVTREGRPVSFLAVGFFVCLFFLSS